MSNVAEQISAMHLKEKTDNRTALDLIFETLKLCGSQQIAIRGHTELNSNFTQILKLISSTSMELKNWLNRDNIHYLSHDIQNEMIERLASAIMDKLPHFIHKSGIYRVIVDETTDISSQEQVAIRIRSVDPTTLTVREDFIGFHVTAKADGEILFSLLKIKQAECKLELTNMRGQGYDGAGAMRGRIKGLETRVREVVPQAMYCYCAGHALNLVIQDSVRMGSQAESVMTLISFVVNYVKDSPKRLASFKVFQADGSSALRPLSTTRWVCRYPAVASFVENYEKLMDWFEARIYDGDLTSDDRSKALSTLKSMEKFRTYYMVGNPPKAF